jgi:hypothetical protein
MSLLDHLWNQDFICAGDLEGDGQSQTVVGLRGNPINVGTPLVGQALVWNGTSWVYEDWVKPDLDVGPANSVYASNGSENAWSTSPTLGSLELVGTSYPLRVPDGHSSIALNVPGVGYRTILARDVTDQIDVGHSSYALRLLTNGTLYVAPTVLFTGANTVTRYLKSSDTTVAAGAPLVVQAQNSTYASGVGGSATLSGGTGATDGDAILTRGATERLRTTATGTKVTGSVTRLEDDYGVLLKVIQHASSASTDPFDVDLNLATYELTTCESFDVRFKVVALCAAASGSGSFDAACAYTQSGGDPTVKSNPQVPGDVTHANRCFYTVSIVPTATTGAFRLTITPPVVSATKWVILTEVVGCKP